tara:strand:+ start:324 stop:524 length:201 start_codon:yes stop_codon:yes gene_type:complete
MTNNNSSSKLQTNIKFIGAHVSAAGVFMYSQAQTSTVAVASRLQTPNRHVPSSYTAKKWLIEINTP